MRLKNMTAVVTGGASGMSESMCHALAAEGASIVVVDQNIEGANKVAADLIHNDFNAIAIKANVASQIQVRLMANKAVDAFGKVDILVNNAGSRLIKGFLEHTKDDWNKMLDINLSGPFYCSQEIVPKMIISGGGTIINVCSIASYMGRPNRCAYVAAKSGLLGLTRTMAIDLAQDNIRVNAISPGMIASPFNQRFSEGEKTGPSWAKDNLIGRWGNPDDINGAIVFLASNEASFITGSDIKVEGGWLAARARIGEEAITSD